MGFHSWADFPRPRPPRRGHSYIWGPLQKSCSVRPLFTDSLLAAPYIFLSTGAAQKQKDLGPKEGQRARTGGGEGEGTVNQKLTPPDLWGTR